ncbi:MAG: DNA repair protein RecN [Clostridia bacterium]|nr:DNA repair protein RecN [Clostridia bacterium]
MLQNLKIENVAIIESADILFEKGLNILTGETGAGKSIVIDSINAILGERTSRELVRTGCNKASVTALFKTQSVGVSAVLDELGIESEADGSLLISRSISLDGKNVCRINGMPVTVGMLKTLGRELINIHGQHDSQQLLNPETHCSFVDKLAGNDSLLSEYASAFDKLSQIRREIASLQTDDAAKARKIELLTYQIDEIENASLTVGEMEELKAVRTLHRNSEKIIGNVNEAYALLNGADEMSGALEQIKMSARQLDSVSQYYSALDENAEKLREIGYLIEDVQDRLSCVMDELEYDPQYAQAVEDRLDYLNRLSRKYGETEEEMLDFCEKCKKERQDIELSDERLIQLEAEEKKQYEYVVSLAERLTQSRKTTGVDFSEKVREELVFLDMPNVVFSVDIRPCALNENGADEVEFLISPNLGEAPKPMAKIASGGELSRIMLAIKNVLSDKDGTETLIFDEIDAGVSGRAASKLGKKLAAVSDGRQVICVTHLAQIAAQADHHFEISKASHGGKTYTSVTPLDFDGRKRELARIIGGEEITQAQLDMAAEMLTKI